MAMASLSALPGWVKRCPPAFTRVLRFAAAIAILIGVAWFTDVAKAVEQLKQTDWRWLLPAFVVVQFQVVLSAVRWKVTANRLGQHLSTGRAIVEYYLATFANLSLPGGVTGDAARVYRNRQTKTLSVAVHGVVLERLAGQLALLVVAIVGWTLWPIFMQASAPDFGMRVLGIMVGLLVLAAFSTYLIIRFAPDWVTRTVLDFGPAFRLAWWADRQWLVQGVLSLAIVISYMLVFLFSSYAVQAPLSLPAVITLVPLVLLSMLIPLSIGGWGIREASAAILWPIAGLSSEAGIATSVVYALVSLLGCLPGLIFLVFKPRV